MPGHIRAPSSPGKQSTSKSLSCEAALGCGACPRVHFFELACLQTGRKAGQAAPVVRQGCLEVLLFQWTMTMYWATVWLILFCSQCQSPGFTLYPTPSCHTLSQWAQPQQCLRAMVQTRWGDKSYLFLSKFPMVLKHSQDWKPLCPILSTPHSRALGLESEVQVQVLALHPKLWPVMSHLTELGLSFHICKMGIRKPIVLEEYSGSEKIKSIETLW